MAIRWLEDDTYDPKYDVWTRANVGEVLPEPPSPLGWDLLFGPYNRLGWRDTMTNRMGIQEHEISWEKPEILGLFGGYAYLGLTLIRVWAERTPGFSADAIDAAYFGGADVPEYKVQDWHENAHTTEVMAGWLGWVMGDMDQSEVQASAAEARQIRTDRPDLAAASDAELLERARAFGPTCRRMFDEHINESGAASIAPGALGEICAALGRPEAAMRLIAGLGGVDSAAPSFAMWDLSRAVRREPVLVEAFDAGPHGLHERLRAADDPTMSAFVSDLDAFLAEFGSRGPNEWDLYSHTWETNPDIVLAAIDRMRLTGDDGSPADENARREGEREALAAELAPMLEADPEAAGTFQAALASAAVFLPGRERTKTNIIRVIGEVRMALWELGRRLVERGDLDEARDICMLFDDELDAAVAGTMPDLRATVAERLEHYAFLQSRQERYIVSEAPDPVAEWPARASVDAERIEPGGTLQGVGGCPGTYRGRARVVLDAADPVELEPGDVLIAPMTDPAWTPLFVPAGGVVVDVGAPLSHAIIVSRELGIPCVVSATHATKRIADGAIVEVDGDSGVVTVIELP